MKPVLSDWLPPTSSFHHLSSLIPAPPGAGITFSLIPVFIPIAGEGKQYKPLETIIN